MGVVDERGDQLIFVTQNTRDFGGPDGALHAELENDLRDRNAEGLVILSRSLEQFVEKYITPSMEQLNSYLRSLEGDSPPIDIRAWADSRLASLLDAYDYQDELIDPAGLSASINGITIKRSSADDAVRLPSSAIFVKCSFDVTFDLSISTDWDRHATSWPSSRPSRTEGAVRVLAAAASRLLTRRRK